MAKILKYVLGLDGANRFDSFYSVGAPAQDFVRYSAVDNRDNHVTDEEFDVEFFRSRWHRDPSPAEKGCMLSHVKMWRDFVASDADWALIAEDDILLSPDAEAVVNAIITKYPQVQLVNLSDSFANDAGKLNPQVEYIRLSLLSPFVHGKYRMGKPYGTWPLICTGLYLISRSGAELLLKQFAVSYTHLPDSPKTATATTSSRGCAWAPTAWTTSTTSRRENTSPALPPVPIIPSPSPKQK